MANAELQEVFEGEYGEMTLMGHLDELRQRLTIAFGSVLITTVITFIFAQFLVELLAYPLNETAINPDTGLVEVVTPGIERLESIDVTENISVFMRVSLMGGLILAMPIMIYQLIAYIVPGLTPQEKRILYIGIPSATILFLGGVTFAYYVVLPTAVPFLLQFLGIPTAPRPKTYFEFVTKLIFWIGVSFEMPLVMGILSKLGVLSPEFLIRNARYAVVIIAIAAALITPTPDPVNMGLVMAPLLVLYGIGIVLARFLYSPRDTT